MAIKATGFKVNTVAATVAADGATATVTLPYSALGADVSITDVTATGSAEASPVYTGSVPAGTKVASGNVTVTIADNASTPVTAPVTLTITVEAVPAVVKPKFEDIPMAGWFPAKMIDLNGVTYTEGGFTTPYNVIAVLAVNAPKYTGYVYKDTSGSKPVQKIKLFNGADEASGELTGVKVLVLTQL